MNDKNLKSELRRRFLGERRKLDPDKKKAFDFSICSAIRSLSEYKAANNLLVYSPIKNEIDLESLFAYSVEDNKSTLFPRCFGKEMRFAPALYNELEIGSYGISEPKIDARYVTCFADTDICILPCLCSDRNGYRLGYGGGFYDKFLVDFPGVKIIAVYSEFVVDDCFAESFDIAADIIVTEKEIWRI